MIDIRHLTKHYRDVRAVEDISLEIPKQTSLVILGPSGSGKTTLLRLIAGLEIPDKGEIAMNGEKVSAAGWALVPNRRSIGFVFQAPALWPHMTVARNILFGLHGMSKSEAHGVLQELLARMSLTKLADRYPHQISGGEARRVALARALAPQPSYLLLDEPLTSLDPDLKEEMISLIHESVHAARACLVYVTHDANEASRIAERVVLLKDGRIEANKSLPAAEKRRGGS